MKCINCGDELARGKARIFSKAGNGFCGDCNKEVQ